MKTRASGKLKGYLVSYGFTLPYMLVFITFTVAPVAASIILSFTNFDMLQIPKFMRISNYTQLFMKDDIFPVAARNTLFFALITGPLGYILCFMFAWMINELSPRLRAVLTLFFYAPSIAGNMSVIWTIIFSGDDHGLLNGTLMRLGILSGPVLWLKDVRYMAAVMVVVILWSSLGASFLAFIAGFQSIDRSLFEAGSVDGIRNRWQELWYITLPAMRPQLMFGAVMSISSSFGIGTVITGLVGFPSTDYAVHTLVHHLEDYGTVRYQMGYASAIATVLFVIMVLSNKLVQKIIAGLGSWGESE